VPGEIPCTNAPHLYRVQPRPGANVASPSDVAGGGAFVPGGGTTGTNEGFNCFYVSFL
jgi:hypothetical protein